MRLTRTNEDGSHTIRMTRTTRGKMAKNLMAYLKESAEFELKHTHALDAISHMLGWRLQALSAEIKVRGALDVELGAEPGLLTDAPAEPPTWACAFCGAPATCFGTYEQGPPGFACDVCCGHGCEDGRCVPTVRHDG